MEDTPDTRTQGTAGKEREQSVTDHAQAPSSDRAPSMRDVAHMSGVTYQTVSRVINDSPRVAPATRARVLAAIDVLGYRPNGSARALASGRSATVGVVSIGTSAFETPSTLEGIDQAAARAGYSIMFASAVVTDARDVKRAVDSLIARSVDGLIVIAPRVETNVATLGLPTGLPYAVIEGARGQGNPSVVLDQAHGARIATEHLLATGAETVWHVAGPSGWHDSIEREKGWREALAAHGAKAPPMLQGDWSHASGFEAGRLLASIETAHAVFVANDDMALGAMHALHQAGRHIPDDVSLVGFDDLPEAAFSWPSLTTVHQDFFAIGQLAIAELLAGVRGQSDPVEHIVVPNLMIRDSTLPLPE